MSYSKPAVQSFSNIHYLAESQYLVGLVPDGNGCPTLLFDGDTGTGFVDYEGTLVLNIHFDTGATCTQNTVHVSGHAAFQNNALVLDCSNQEEDCNFNKCSIDANRTGAELCLESFTINGVDQGANICVPVSLNDIFDIEREICSQ